MTVSPADRVTGAVAIRAETTGREPSCHRLVVDTGAEGTGTTVVVPE